jgi:Tfp pilus assembly protein PilW
MKKFKPRVHLIKTYEGSDEIYHLHVVTLLEETNFVTNGNETLPITASSGKWKVVLNVKNASLPNFALRTPIVHTLTLTGVDLSSEEPLLEVIVQDNTDTSSTTTVGSRNVHRDDADDDALPSPGGLR